MFDAMLQYNMKYSIPLCVTLYGHEGAQFGLPVLMTAIPEKVTVWINDKNVPDDAVVFAGNVVLERILKESQTFIENVNVSPKDVYVDVGYSLDSPDVVASIIACVVLTLAGVKAKKSNLIPTSVQAGAYSVEKAILKDQSHAQSVTALQNALVFYRKEFEFYKTVMKMPMKIPHDILDNLQLKPQVFPVLKKQSAHFTLPADSSKEIKKLIFALQKEDTKEIQSLLRLAVS